MAFRYKFKTSQSQIKKIHEQFLKRMEAAIISRLEFVGWEFVKMARENGRYNDITGNLRSSIGFTVISNGKTIVENFENAPKGTDKTMGVQEAKKYIRKLKAEYSTGYALIVVAGMDYAASVESKGKDVITGSSLIAEASLNKAFAKLKKKSLF